MTEEEVQELRLRFSGRHADQHEIPAVHLVRALEGLQRAVYLLAMDEEDVEVRSRDKVSRAIEETYAIRCAPPKAGSVTFDLMLGDPSVDLIAAERVSAVAEKFIAVGRAVAAAAREELRRLIPDRVRRTRLLEAMKKVPPRRGTGITLDLQDAKGEVILDSPSLERSLPMLLSPPAYEEAVQTLTGRFKAIDFDRHELSLYHPPTHRDLRCVYDASVEELLLTKPRELIQVTGRVVLDEGDQPKEILDVQDIREVDLSPFYLSKVALPGRTLLFREDRRLEPELDETEQLFLLQDEELGVDVMASTRDELYEALLDNLDFLWRNYAAAPDALLTSEAVALKGRLLSLLTEVPDAEG